MGAILPRSMDSSMPLPHMTITHDENNNSMIWLTKYCQVEKYGLNGYTDLLTTLQAEDDAATQILGAGWRTPTQNEFSQLRDNCNWSWDSSKKCYRITSKKNSSNYIYLNITGHIDSSFPQTKGYYWTSSLVPKYPTGAYYFEIEHVSNDVNYDIRTSTSADRKAQYFIRAVRDN